MPFRGDRGPGNVPIKYPLTGDTGRVPGGGPQPLLTAWGPMLHIPVEWGALWSPVDIGVQRCGWLPPGVQNISQARTWEASSFFGVMCGCRPPRAALAG